MGKEKNMLHKLLMPVLSVFLSVAGIVCMVIRISGANWDLKLDVIAAELVMPADLAGVNEYDRIFGDIEKGNGDQNKSGNKTLPASEEQSGEIKISSSDEEKDEDKITEKSKNTDAENDKSLKSSDNAAEFKASEATEEEIEKYREEHNGEKEYPVKEFNTTEGNVSYNDVKVKNISSKKIDIRSELEGKLGFTMESTSEPQVLIYHTHTCESFLPYDTGSFFETYYPRTTDSSANVCAVGDEIARQLNAEGIVTLHDKTLHDHPSYSGAYDRSTDTVNKYLSKYPTIKVELDIHRDGIGSDTEKSKPVFTYNGRKAAQIMILSGYNYDNSEDFKEWEYNLRFALKIQQKAQQMFPGMVRALDFGDFMYNMNINTGSLLIEVGAEGNTLEEVRYSGYLLGKVLADVLSENKLEKTAG